jgi:hypothetical protein
VTDKKESNCGCGCLPESKKGAQVQKLEVKKSEKPKD